MSRDRIVARTRVFGALDELQNALGLTSAEMSIILNEWHLDHLHDEYVHNPVEGSDVDLFTEDALSRRKKDLDDLWLTLAAVCKANGGTLSVSTSELLSVRPDRFVGQRRIDGSGTDFYFLPD
jgi:hypothetical protein